MAKTIEDRAKEFAQISQNETWEQTRIRIWKQVSFEFGANSVLEEIEKAFPFRNYPNNGSFNEKATLKHLKEILEQLKGK